VGWSARFSLKGLVFGRSLGGGGDMIRGNRRKLSRAHGNKAKEEEQSSPSRKKPTPMPKDNQKD